MGRTISWQTVAPLVGAHGSPRPAPNDAVDRPRVIPGIREPALSLRHDRTTDFVAALVSAIALIGTVPVRVTAVWVVRVVGIRIIEWKRRKERKTEVVDKNDTVEVVMKSMVAIEVVESSEIGYAV
jgi:hypothetical protein